MQLHGPVNRRMRAKKSEEKTQSAGKREQPPDRLDVWLTDWIVILEIKTLTVCTNVICKQVVDSRCDVQTESPKGDGKRNTSISCQGEAVIQLKSRLHPYRAVRRSHTRNTRGVRFFSKQISRRNACKKLGPPEKDIYHIDSTLCYCHTGHGTKIHRCLPERQGGREFFLSRH